MKLPNGIRPAFQIEPRQIHHLVRGKFNLQISTLSSVITPSLLSVTPPFSCSTCCYHYYLVFMES